MKTRNIPFEFSNIVGLTFVDIEANEGDYEVTFTTDTGRVFRMTHIQDCCESVYLQDVVGEWTDLIGNPITLAECVNNAPAPEGSTPVECDEWTFYKLATIRGYVDMRWFGTSNGYYSTDVSLMEVTK